MTWFEPAVHTHHVFDRLVSTSDTGMAIYGCSFGHCGATEVRGVGERSPFAIKHQQTTKRRAEARRTRARQGRS